MIRILIADPLSPEALEKLSEIAEFEIVEQRGSTPQQLAEEIAAADAVVVRSATKLTRPILERAARLKLIVRAGIGTDNIDTEYAAARGISVRNTPGATSVTVAEYTIGLMLSACRFLPPAYQSMKEGRWDRALYAQGMELSGKTAGIVGFGRIGQEVAKRLIPMGVRVVYHDILDVKSGLDAKPLALQELLVSADFVLLHVPLTPQTRGLISTHELELMKKGAILVNTSRGGVIDEDALCSALDAGALRAAALDVYASEPPHRQDLISHPRVFPFPHLGSSTQEGQERASLDVVRNLVEFFNV